MKTEVRTFEDVVQVSKVARYTQAERIGLIPGDYIISFGIHAPKEIIADAELLGAIKRTDWLFIMRGETAFRLAFGEGVEGAAFEPAKALEDVLIPTGIQWPQYWGGIQSTGEMMLVPDHISPVWAIMPPLLYTRFRNWQMLTAIVLVWCVGLNEGPVTFAMAYLVSVAAALFGGAAMMREASERQGYVPRGRYQISKGSDAAALEMLTAERLRRVKAGLPPILPTEEVAGGTANPAI